jgi:hypothetical protein
MENYKKTIGILLTLTMALSMVIMLPAADSAVPVRSKTTYAFCTVTPTPIGVGQEALVWMGISDYLNIYTDGWKDLTVSVTKPDNTTETLGPFRTDSTGSTGTKYIPTLSGTYYFQSHFPAQWYNWTNQADVLYKASDSPVFALNVTEDFVQYYPSSSLPTEYWTRPVNAQNREWAEITGNWLWGQSLNNYPYYNWKVTGNSYAPEAGHILWTKAVTDGGIAGAEIGTESFFPGDAYEGYFLDSLIIGGVLYYNKYQGDGGTRVEQVVVAVDLKTGQQLWERNFNNTRITFGQVLKYNSFNTQGAYPYLWSVQGSTWNAYDAATGRWEYGMTNVPSGATPILGPNGELLIYTVNAANGWVSMWNSTKVVIGSRTDQTAGSWIRSDKGRVFDAMAGIQWNKTIPKTLPGIVLSVLEDRIIGGTDDTYNTHLAIIKNDYSHTFWCISTKPGQEGTILFNKTWVPTTTDVASAFVGASSADGIMIVALKDTRQIVALSLDTGNLLWGPTESQTPVDVFTIGNYRRGAKAIADGMVFSGGMGGRLHAYEASSGNLLWTYDVRQEFTEMQWSDNWPIYLSFIADGKIYLHSAEHSVNQPLPRGAPFVCLNETTGEKIWSINLRGTHWGGYPIIGDSTIAMFNTYDNRIYALGKGPSQTTIVASPKISTEGSSVLLEGYVTDISPGLNDFGIRARFPQGVAAVSDASQSEWMTYVYDQLPKPADATGVQVVLNVIDSNGNFREIGKTTTDSNGFYNLQWTPDITGKYVVIAQFSGSNSYYPSYAESAFVVDAAAATPTPTVTPPQSAADMYFVPAIAGLFVLVIVVAIVLALLMLRKRP